FRRVLFRSGGRNGTISASERLREYQKKERGCAMKRRRRTLGLALAFCLAALCLTPSALANGWRLRGELVQYVLETNRWDEYTALESQGEHCAVMHTDYHNELLVALDGQLFYTTRAVYQ